MAPVKPIGTEDFPTTQKPVEAPPTPPPAQPSTQKPAPKPSEG